MAKFPSARLPSATKPNIAPFSLGLQLVNRLRPITFDWKADGMHDLGLGAEEVAAVEPLLVTYNKAGQVEGVKYDRVGVVLLNAVKERQAQIEGQQAQIEGQRKQLTEQQRLINGLRQLVCAQNPTAEVCQPEPRKNRKVACHSSGTAYPHSRASCLRRKNMLHHYTTHDRPALLLLLPLVLCLSAVTALGQQSGSPQIPQSVIAGGGGTSTNSKTRLEGTIGQAALGISTSVGYTLVGGFWGAYFSLCAAP